MKTAEIYLDLDGNEIALATLDAEERRLIARLRRRARTHPDWTDFDNYWMRELLAFHDARGRSRTALKAHATYRIAQDLSARLGIAAGLVRPDDCASDLAELIRTLFASEAAFCKATGLGREAIDNFVAGRGDIPVEALQQGLERIGYSLRIRPMPVAQERGSAKASCARTPQLLAPRRRERGNRSVLDN